MIIFLLWKINNENTQRCFEGRKVFKLQWIDRESPPHWNSWTRAIRLTIVNSLFRLMSCHWYKPAPVPSQSSSSYAFCLIGYKKQVKLFHHVSIRRDNWHWSLFPAVSSTVPLRFLLSVTTICDGINSTKEKYAEHEHEDVKYHWNSRPTSSSTHPEGNRMLNFILLSQS